MKRNLYSYFLLGLLIILSNHSQSQVFSLVSSPVSKLNYAIVNEQYGFAMVGGTNQFKSIDQGLTWTQLSSGSGSPLYQFEAQNIAVSSASTMCLVGYSVATASYIVARTADGGSTWSQALSTSYSEPLKDIAANGNTLIVTGVNGIYRSTDSGLTWTFTSLSSGGQFSPFVRYNNASSSWIIGGYLANYQSSTDDGVTWQNLMLGFNPDANIIAESEMATGLLIARKTASTTQMLLLNASNAIDTTAIIQSNLLMNNTPCATGAFFNGNLLTHNQSLFYQVDPANNNVYHFGFPLSGLYIPKEISLGTNYGVAISSTSNSGGSGRIYRIDLAQSPNLYVPSYFNIAGPGPCAGDPIIASPTANYADSVKWYVNNVMVSTANTLNYPTSAGVYTTYNVKLVTYYHGVSNTTTKPVVMSAASAPPPFSYSVDTTACYGLPLHVSIGAYSSPNTSLKMLYNGTLVYGPVTMTGYQTNAYIQNITTSGDLEIIMFKTHPCDQSTYSVTRHITVGPNLYGFTTLPHDSVICVGINPELTLNGTVSQNNYDFYTTYSFGNWTSSHIVVPGNSNGSLNVDAWGTDIYQNNSVEPEAYGPMYMYVHLKVTDTEGCAPDKIIDTIRIQRSKAYFELHSRSFLQNDTVHLSNAYVTPNRLWSSEELNPQYITNTTDTIPLIIADTVGFFGIKLRNEPIPQCADSVTKYIHYANQAPEFDSACIIKKAHEKDRLHKVRIDQFGNIYEIRAYFLNTYYYPRYILRKNDAFGNLIWEKRAPDTYTTYDGVNGVVMEEIDFDDEGNPVVGLWIQGAQSYQDEYIDYVQPNVNLQGKCYVLKLDKNNGDLIWRADLSDIAPSANLSTGVRVTDVVVDGDLIHATTYSSYNLDFFTLNNETGALVNTSPLDLGTWSNSGFMAPGFLFPTGSLGNSSQSYWSPQIDVLSTGEVVAIGYCLAVNSPNYPQLNVNGAGMFIMKYHPDLGVYDVNKMVQTGYVGYGEIIPRMFVDKNDNITVAGLWENNFWNPDPNPIFKIFDSIMPMESGSFVINFDSDYHINWFTKGTHANIEDLVYIPKTNETYLAVKTKDNYSIGNGSAHLRLGEEKMLEFNYTHLPDWQYEWLDYYQQQGFLIKLNEAGEPVEMKEINHNSNDSVLQSQRLIIRMAGTACGDLAIYTDNLNPTFVEVDDQVFVMDSVLLILQYSNCASDDCSYLNADDSLQFCGSSGLIDIQLVDYYNLNTLSYDVIVNGTTLLTNQSVTVVNGHFSIPQPVGGTQGFKLAFTDPNADTLIISYTDLVVDFGAFPSELCIYNDPIPLGNSTPAGGVYSGPGVVISPSQFYPVFAGAGTHVITYTYTNEEGCSKSDTVSIFVDNCLNIATNDLTMFQMYPNPFTDELHLVFFGETIPNYQAIVVDHTGRIILQEKINQEETILLLNQLSKGNYTLEVLEGNKCIHREQIVKM